MEFPAPLGRLEAFVTSGGLSTSPWTFEGRLKRAGEQTLRYPGHVAQFKAFSDLGLLGLDPIDVAGQKVVPRDVFHALLAPQICRSEVKDVCVMRVKGIGTTKGKRAEATVELVDRYDEQTGFTAMQRLTGWHGSIPAHRRGEPDGPARRGVGGALPPGQDHRQGVQAPRVRDDGASHVGHRDRENLRTANDERRTERETAISGRTERRQRVDRSRFLRARSNSTFVVRRS